MLLFGSSDSKKKNSLPANKNGEVQLNNGSSRGVRNNNPFNLIKGSSNWIGKVTSKDSDFEQFDTMENGIRAGLINLRNTYYKKGLVSVEQIISKYCPPSGKGNTLEGTQAYIDYISQHVFLSSGSWKLSTVGKELKLAYHMLNYENGFEVVTLQALTDISKKNKIF